MRLINAINEGKVDKLDTLKDFILREGFIVNEEIISGIKEDIPYWLVKI